MNNKKLLILDDDLAVAQTISFVAESVGFEVRIFDDPNSFLEMAGEWLPTHIALDLVMPAMDGVEVLANLSDMNCQSAIIVTSGMGTKVLESAQIGALERGLNVRGILPKPFKNLMLKELLSDHHIEHHKNGSSYKRNSSLTVVEQTIAYGITCNQFGLYYQPKIDFKTNQAIGFEGLMRWDHPDFGLILPDAFISVAESTGQIDQMTHQIIRVGLEWLSHLDSEITLALNISAKSLRDNKLINILVSECSNFNIDPNRIILELTETSTMMDPVESLNLLTRLRIKGFRLSIDDFGTGYSSMVQLARLPFSELKIDRSFIMSMDVSNEAQKIVASTIGLGRSLGLTTVAEGVENLTIHNMLHELDCQLGQGYHYAKPMAPDLATHWLNNWNI
jgi:EAL domain-containing protein (putative c-di-GMP-specific phosphodiesterase class I)/ActR/RegA family two-component response regulator